MEQWKIWLVVADGPNEGDTIPVCSEQFLIGHRATCHFRPPGEGVADLHCALLVREGRFFLRNFHKPGGTFVGGRQVLGGIELRDGDRFQVGDWQLQARIARRTSPAVEPVPSEAEMPAAPVPTVLCDVGWSSSSAPCPGGTAQFFVACSSVLPTEELPAPAVTPVASEEPSYLPATGGETESSTGENSGACADLGEGELQTLPIVEESAPGTVAESAPDSLPATAGETESAIGHGAPAETFEVVPSSPEDSAPDPGVDSSPEEPAPGAETAPQMVAEAHEETAYRHLAALEMESDTDTPAADTPAASPTPPRPSRYSSIDESIHIETGRPRKEVPDTGAEDRKGRRLLVGRLDRAMPTLRKQEWEDATQPKVRPVRTAPPPKTWTRWLPALGGVVLGMALLGGGFYLAKSRASSPVRRSPPHGVIRTGREVFIPQPASSDQGAVEQRSPPRADGPHRSDGGRVPPRGVAPADRPRP
jgi:FHA domain